MQTSFLKSRGGTGLIAGVAAVILLIAWSAFSPHPKTADPMADASPQDMSLDQVFARSLASVNEERRTNRASEFGCTERFSDFRRYQTIEPYVEFFRRIGLQPIQVDQNRQHFVYVELTQKELSSRGYLNFRGGDRLVLVFTTNSAASTEITSFTANFFTGVPS